MKMTIIYHFQYKNSKTFYFLFLKFIFRGEGREKGTERNIHEWLPILQPLPGTWPMTQACATTENWTSDPLLCRPTLNPLSYISQDHVFLLFSSTVVSILSPQLSPAQPTPTSHPRSYPSLALSMGPLYMFLDDLPLFSHYPFPPPLWLLSVCSLFQCLWL